MVVVDLALATICLLHGPVPECHPALVGPSTPRGEFSLVQRLTEDRGYGGDVVQFHEDEKAVFAIHRVWTLRPVERREHRLRSGDPKQRASITNGCVNVSPEVYDRLVGCCLSYRLVIR